MMSQYSVNSTYHDWYRRAMTRNGVRRCLAAKLPWATSMDIISLRICLRTFAATPYVVNNPILRTLSDDRVIYFEWYVS